MANNIVRSLASEGISAVVKKVDFDTYISLIKSGDYSAYIGDVRIGANGDLSAFSSGNLGIVSSEFSKVIADTASSIGYEERKKAFAQLAVYVMQEAPIIPLYFKKRGLLLDASIDGNIEPISENIYGSVSSWYKKQ